MESYDAIVIGAGPAGGTAALMLARAGWSVAVVEKSPFPRRKVCGEFISATSMELLGKLGIADQFLALAGPAIRHVGLYAGHTNLIADMPRLGAAADQYGRALGREHLDALLLAQAVAAGAKVLQPFAATQVQKSGHGFCCTVTARDGGESRTLQTHTVIAAHGSWGPGHLPTQARYPHRAADLLAFKAHFRNCSLPPDLMPLLVFPGGYGGMVRSDDDRTSLSCCIRRDYLARCRRESRQARAAPAVLAHILANCHAAADVLSDAQLDESWLAAGPIRPGIRRFRDDGIFCVGNAAGEAHPIVAEGISMALQSAYLLCGMLIARQDAVLHARATLGIACDYSAAWKLNFAPRIRAAAVFAHLAMRPAAARLVLPLARRLPRILTLGAHLSGKAQALKATPA